MSMKNNLISSSIQLTYKQQSAPLKRSVRIGQWRCMSRSLLDQSAKEKGKSSDSKFAVVDAKLYRIIDYMGKSQKKNSLASKKGTHSTAQDSAFMGKYSDAPHYLRDNEHIIEGYRIGFDSPRKVIKSLFMVHNETVNIWTHLIGAVIVLFFFFEGIAYEMEESHILGRALIESTVSPYKQPLPQLDPIDICAILNQDLPAGQAPYECTSIQTPEQDGAQGERVDFDDSIPSWPIMFALLGGTICLSCSAVFHWIHPVNEKIFKLSLGLDFAGIGINMAFSPIPAFYYSFYCHKQTAFIYLSIIIAAGTASFVLNLFDWVHRKENKIIKFFILILSSIACVVGLSHILINEFVYSNYGDSYTIVPALYFFIATLLSYLMGFIFYITRCPERRRPGEFDICGHSHQIWHVFVFIAIILTYLGSIASYEIRSHHSTCPRGIQINFE